MFSDACGVRQIGMDGKSLDEAYLTFRQDLHAFLLDNYFLLTRDEEHGKQVVVSRPIHLDFLRLTSADGVPERRYDSLSRFQKRPGGHMYACLSGIDNKLSFVGLSLSSSRKG
jgi:hypothetical protein